MRPKGDEMDEVKVPRCDSCHKTYDLSGWRTLLVIGAGLFGSQEHGVSLATGATESRRCECGATVMHTFYFASPVPEAQAPAALALALLR